MKVKLEIDSFEDAGFGHIYKATVTSGSLEGSMIAVKRMRYIVVQQGEEVVHVIQYPMLRHEACALQLLQGHRSIPEVYFWATTQYFQYLGLPLLGRDLFSHFFLSRPTRALTVRNLGAIACQMIDALAHVHSRGIIHCDVHIGNMLFKTPGKELSSHIYLIDFGICKPSRSEHIDTPTPWLRGNPLTASLNSHMHSGLSRRDDLESLAYCLINLLEGELPWQNLRNLPALYAAKKQYTGSRIKLPPWPSVFGDFLDYCRSLAHDDVPDYAGWISRFQRISPTLREDFLYDTNDTSTLKAKSPVPMTKETNTLSEVKTGEGWRTVTHPNDPYEGGWHDEEAYTLEEYDMLEDEASVVREIERLEEAPVHEGDIYFDYNRCPPPQLYVGK